jgi:hypothetical protein
MQVIFSCRDELLPRKNICRVLEEKAIKFMRQRTAMRH